MALLCSVVPVRAGSMCFPSCLAVPARRRVPLSAVVLLLSLMFAPQAGLAASPPPLWECIAGLGGSVTVASNLQSPNECIAPLKVYAKDHIVPRICTPYITSGYQVNSVWLHSQENMPDGKQVHYMFEASLLIFNPAGPPMGCVEDYFAVARIQKCPVAPLRPIPASDTCALTLERYSSTQAEKDAACGTLAPAMQTAVACFQNRLGAFNNPATGQPIPLSITASIRNLEYQRHLREVWDKMEELVDRTTRNPALQTACAARRTELAAEKGCNNAGGCGTCAAPTATARNHCLVAGPAQPNINDATHAQGNAIDVDLNQTVNPLQSALNQSNPPQTIQGLLDSPANCNLDYLGARDPVHFQLRP